MATAPNVQDLSIEQIDPSPDNPRLAFGGDLGDLTELTESIRAQGVLQHLVVCPETEGRYQLVFGHRRLAAAKAAGLTEVPAEIRDYDATERFAAMYGENFGREGLTPLQEAWAYQQALNRKGPGGKKLFTQRSLAERLGVSQAKISKYTGIFKLPEHVVAMLTGGELTITEAIHLVLLAKEPARVEAALGDFRQHHDMELAVRTQQSDIERQARVAKTLADLKKQRVRVAPDDWREQGGKRLGDGYYDLHQTPEEHAGEPCHAAMVTHHGDVAWVCTDPDRHRPEPEPAEPAAAAPAVAGEADVQRASTGRAAAGSDVDLPAWPSTDAAPGSVGEGKPALAVDPAPAEPDPEELAAKARMEQARKAAEEERLQREQAAQEREANVTAAYEARTAALRTLLGGRLSRPEVTRLLANFMVRLAFRDYYYDDGFLRHALSLDETAAAGEESPVLAFAARNEDGLLRAAVAVVAENAEDALAAGEELNFTDPVFRLYLDFLTTVAAYRPTEFEQAELQAAAGGEEATAALKEGADDGEEAAAEEPAGVT
jgi:ParB family transcriptional regulator, chromosome partitioning protein